MNVKKKRMSFLLMAIVIAVLLPSGALETTVYAESLGLTPISSWRYATHRASSGKQVDKVYQLAKAKASSSVAARLHDVMYDATYRPAVNGGSKWRSGWITSVYDKGLDTTVTFSGSQGCFSYANYISKYVRGSTGQRRLIPQDKPSAEDIRLFLEANADPGEHFHFFNTVYGREHSFIYLASDKEGFYVLSSSAGANVEVFYCTYKKFLNVLRYDNGPPVVLYDTNGSSSGAGLGASSRSTQVSYSDPAKCKVLYQRVLRPSGSTRGSDVTYMQCCLKYLGYSITVDGCYGNGTAAVVKKFQSDHGVKPVDGICGLVTWNAIEKAVAQKKNPSRTPVLTASATSVAPAAPAAPTVSSVSVKQVPDREVYTVGETFNAAGLRLKVTYSDGTSENVTSGFTCSPSGQFSRAGQQKIVVTYGGKSTGFYVNVMKAVSSVLVKSKPSKTTYTVGETFNTKGLTLKVTYSDGTSENVTSGFTCSPSGQFSKAGQQKIVVTYGGQSTGFFVNVVKEVASVSIKTKPSKTAYTVGEALNTKGLTLKVTYSDGTSENVTSGFTCSPSGQFSKAGQQKIVVTYGGQSTGFFVTVDKKLSSVAIRKKPAKLTYTVGESFDASGMTLVLTYSDGSTKTVTGGYTCSPSGQFSKAGEQKIVVSYGGQSTGFYVTVEKALSSVTIRKKPSKLTYAVGESFDASGMILTLHYNDGSTEDVSSGFTCSSTSLSTPGQQKIVVSFHGKSTGFYVDVE